MSNFLEQENCSIHNQTCVAIDITQQVDAERRLLCVKCMAEKLSLNNAVLLNDEAAIILKEMKLKEFERKKSEIEQCLLNYQTSITKIQDYMDWQNGCLNKILVQFNSQVEKIQSELNQLKEPKVDDLVKSDIPVLYQNSNQQDQLDQKQIDENNQEKMKEFFKQMEKQLQSIVSEEKLQSILNHVNEIINEKDTKIEQIQQKVENCFESKKTPFLEHECSKHGQEIIMFVINEEYENEKSVCVDCIPDITTKLTTLREANKMWLIHQGEIYDSNYEFFNVRDQLQQKIQAIISKYQEKARALENEIMQLINIQNKEIKTKLAELESNKNKKQLMQLDQKELKNVINLLSKNDRMSQAKEFQKMIKLEDQQYQKEILKKLKDFEQVQQNCRQELLKLFDVNDLLFQDAQIQLIKFQEEIDNLQSDSSLFTYLIPKFQNELQQSLLILMKKISDKGHQYIKQLSKADSIIQDKEQDQINILRYQEVLCQFDRYYKERELSINTIVTSQIKYKIKKFEFKDQFIQTNKNLNINPKIIGEHKKLTKKGFSISRQLSINWSRPYDPKLLKFSKVFKHENVTISADGKTAKANINSDLFCLCDQPIPKYGPVVVDFKIKQFKHMYAGICLKDSIKGDYRDYEGIDKGCYFLRHDGYIYSHHDQDKNSKQLGFKYEQNDVISMIVNVQQRQITWRNRAKNNVYTLDIQTVSDLYFCFQLRDQTEIELL